MLTVPLSTPTEFIEPEFGVVTEEELEVAGKAPEAAAVTAQAYDLPLVRPLTTRGLVKLASPEAYSALV